MTRVALGLLAVALFTAGAAEAGFAFRKPLVVRGARVVGGAHSDFPVLVSIVDPNLRTTAFGGNVRSASGHDVEFRANDLVTVLDHELESYTPSTGALVAWVRVPSLTAGTDVTIHVYHGDPGVKCARNNPARVWNSAYRYVYHLAGSGAANPADSTANAVPAVRNPTADAGIVNAYTASGWIAGAIDLQAGPVVPPAGQFLPTTPTHVRVSDGALGASPAFTLEVWFRADTKTVGAFYGLLAKGRESADWVGAYALAQGANHRFGLGWPLPAGNVGAAPNLATGQWYHGVVSSTGGANPTRTAYLDGAQIQTSAVAAALAAIALPTRLGDDSNGSYLDGQLDEVRASNVARSATWITTTYQNHRCPSLSAFPAGCVAGNHFVDDSGAAVAAGLPLLSNATTGSGLATGGNKAGGLAWSDWNGDGCQDVLVNTSDALVASRLYLQDKSATCTGAFTDVSSCIAAGIVAVARDRSAVWGDLNGDGRPDFARDSNTGIEVYLNNGPGLTNGAGCPAAGVAWTRFGNPATGNPSQLIDGAVFPGLNTEGLGFLDYDADGDLDLLADNATNGITIFANNGAGVLAAAAGTGLPGASGGNGDYLTVGDYDVDGDVDVFARRDDGATVWADNGAAFAINPASPEVAVNGNKGGVAMCDLDDDRDLDLVWTDALNGIAGSAGAEIWRNNGEGGTATTWTNFPLTFVPAPAGGENVDGMSCGDVDNDGDLDLVFASGANDYLFRNDGAFSFVNVTPAAFGAADGAGLEFADSDRDGDLDLLVNQNGGNQLWRNETGGNNYLMVRPLRDVDGGGPGTVTRDAIGATVSLRSCAGTPVTGVRQASGGSGRGSQGALPVHFGLPTSGSPSGPNQIYVVRVQFVGGVVRQKAIVPSGLGCYQEVSIRDTDADDNAVCVANAVELQALAARACDAAVEVRWSTASELDNLGFHVHRSERRDGPYARVTPAIVPGLGSSATGRSYSWLDGSLANGTTYYYRLEDVDAASVSTFHGPVWATPEAGLSCAAAEPQQAKRPQPRGPRGSWRGRREPCPSWIAAELPTGEAARAVCTRYGDPDAAALETLSRDGRGATLELRTTGFWTVQASGAAVRVMVPGFDSPADPLAAALPLRRALVEATVGRGVRLVSARGSGRHAFAGLLPAQAGAAQMELRRDGTVRPSRRVPGSEGLARGPLSAPRQLARLADAVFQGERKSAVVEIAPIAFDPSARGLVLHDRVVVKLAFTGRAAGETGAGSRGRRRPRPRAEASEVLARLHATQTGLHAIRFEQLPEGTRRTASLASLSLVRRGQPLAFRVEPSQREFGPGGTLYFHVESAAASTDYTGERVFELVTGADPRVLEAASAAPGSARAGEPSVGESRFEVNRIYQPGLLEAPDVWLWEAVGGGTERSVDLQLSGVEPAAAQAARIEVLLQGASDSGAGADHHVRIQLNGEPLGEARFAGKRPFTAELSVPAARLVEGSNRLTIRNVGDTGVASMVFLDAVTVSHPQRSVARGGRFEGTFGADGAVRVDGLSAGAVVLDATAGAWLADVERGPGFVRFQARGGHRYLAVAPEGLRAPRVSAPLSSTLRSAANELDYLVIAPRDFLASAQRLVERREAQGLAARAVAFEEVVSEFGGGEPSADAIRELLVHAFHTWTRRPRYVLLLGDGSSDPQRRLASSLEAPLPALWQRTSYLWTASDPLLAAVNGDDELPDLALGRLPARSADEAERLVDKLLAWEGSGQGLGGSAVLVADDPDAGGDFERDVEDVRASFLSGREARILRVSELGASTRAAIAEAFDDGASLWSYVGHGGAASWASENVWSSWDAASLQPQPRQPLLLTLDCLNGYFVAPAFDSLAESLVKVEGRGAIAAFSPSGLSLDAPAHAYHRALVAELAAGRHERLGDAVLAAQESYAQSGLMPELLAIYHLLGDPATRIR